jgi:hypothetical protein
VLGDGSRNLVFSKNPRNPVFSKNRVSDTDDLLLPIKVQNLLGIFSDLAPIVLVWVSRHPDTSSPAIPGKTRKYRS